MDSRRVGPADRPGADDFQILVCTPTWLSSYVDGEAYRAAWGRHMLIVSEYDVATIKACVERRVNQCQGHDWHAWR
ncbi:Imm8 family immunity protein [Paraburkholderia fungorum]|uniref:Imm8 family immunity protein n=1 Tax=Paraburkholderia fungorum TaxID=134537 RepID=UPI0038B827CB